MTDFEKLKTLLEGWGVPYSAGEMQADGDNLQAIEVTVNGPDDDKVVGYNGFLVTFAFKIDDGSFVNIGIWE